MNDNAIPDARILQDFILAQLERIGKDQSLLAKQLETSATQLNSWLNGKRRLSKKWVQSRAEKLALLLECEVTEILNRIGVTIEEQQVIATQRRPLNKAILQTLAEDESPTEELMSMLLRVQKALGVDLNYETSKELIKLWRAAHAS